MSETKNNESTPSLVGASLRSVQDQERDSSVSLSSSRSPSKSNQKKGISHHEDYTCVHDLVDEGALIHDEQAYDDLLDDTGKLRPSVSQTSIPGVKEEASHNKASGKDVSKERKPPALANEITLEDLEGDSEPVKPEPINSSSEPSVESGHKHSIYELKNSSAGNDMSLEDLIDSQIASMSELSTDFQKRISDKKTKPKVLESSRSTSRRRSNSGVIPDSVIENDSLQQVPAGAREGVYSPLVQSRSQSAVRSNKSGAFGADSNAEKPHLARGDSYKGSHSEYRPGRRADRDDIYTNLSQSSKEYLRSISRSRSRVSKERPVSNKELLDEGALLNDPEHPFDMDNARDDAIDNIDGLHHEILQEESEEEDDKEVEKPVYKPVHDETESVAEIEKEPKEKLENSQGTDVDVPKDVPKLADFEEEELTTPEDSVKDEKEPKLEPEPEYESTDRDVAPSIETGETNETELTEQANEKEALDQPLESIPTDAEAVSKTSIQEKEAAEDDTTEPDSLATDDSKPDDIAETETISNVDPPKEEKDVLDSKEDDINDSEPASANIAAKDQAEVEDEPTVEEEEAKEEPFESNETLEQSNQEKQEDVIDKLEEDDTKHTDTESAKNENDIDTPLKGEDSQELKEEVEKIQPTSDDDELEIPVKVDEAEEEQTSSKNVSELKNADAAGEAERLIKELEDAIDEGDDSLVDSVSKENTIDTKTESTGEDNEEAKSETVSAIAEKNKGTSEVNIIGEETPAAKEIEKEEEPEEIHEPTKEEILELLKNEPVYLYTSLAGGGFHMPTRTNKLATILTGNRIPFTYRDLGTDEEARNVWRRYGRGRLLPAVVRGKDDIIGNWEEIEEANEDYRVRELIYETL